VRRKSFIQTGTTVIVSIAVLAGVTPGVQARSNRRPRPRPHKHHQVVERGPKRDAQYRGKTEVHTYRAFSGRSYWNEPLPANVPIDPNSREIVAFLKADNDYDYIRLAGTSSTGTWGQPIYWARPADPVYSVSSTRYTLPPEFSSLRIPRGVKPDVSSDRAMVVYDLDSGYVAWLWQAVYDSSLDKWTAGGGGISYLNSNGLDRRWKHIEGTDPRNRGHRGVPAPVGAVRYDEVRQAGAINHVLKIGVDTTRAQSVFPMVGHENGTTAEFAPPEGTRIRIKPSVNLKSLDLSRGAFVVAKALQTYGAVIGGQSGGNATLKVEHTIAEGRGYLWKGVLSSESLQSLPLDYFEVVKLGYES
jgi:hypothetical protein